MTTLSTIKSQLPYGAHVIIAEKVGITKAAVGQILNGSKSRYYNQVVTEALNIIDEENRKKKALEVKLKKVLSK